MVDDSSLSPNTTTTIQDLPVTLEANVSDPDCGTSAGCDFTATFYIDGSAVGTDSRTSNGTVSTDVSNPDGGTHTWHVEVEDQYGHTDVSNDAEFKVPGTLNIYHENDTDKLVDSVEVTIRFYDGSNLTVERTTTTGQVGMSGLPAGSEFVVLARADGYHDRRIYVRSLVETQNVYLLPTALGSYYNVFKLDDQSGTYQPRTTRLIIQRGLNVSGEFQWTTISGDFFGATNEHKTNLRQDRRYRLIVRNNEGDERVIGSYHATDEANPKFVIIREIVISPPEGQEYYGAAWLNDSDTSDDQARIWFTYSDPDGNTSDLTATIHERGNVSNELATVTVADPGTSFAWNVEVNGSDLQTPWVVNWSATRDGGTIGQQTIPVGNRGALPLPIDPVWLQRFVLVFLPIGAALSSERIATYGAIGLVILAGVLMTLQWYNIDPALWLAAAVIAVGGHALATAHNQGAVG